MHYDANIAIAYSRSEMNMNGALQRRRLPGKLVRCHTNRTAVPEWMRCTKSGSTSLEPTLCRPTVTKTLCSILRFLDNLLLNCFVFTFLASFFKYTHNIRTLHTHTHTYISYIHTYIHTNTNTSSLPLCRNSPKRVRDASFLTFLNHTQWYTSINRTPLDEWSVLCRDLYLTTHNTQKREASVPPAGFKPAIPASDRPYKIQSPTSQKSPLNSTRSHFLCIHLPL